MSLKAFLSCVVKPENTSTFWTLSVVIRNYIFSIRVVQRPITQFTSVCVKWLLTRGWELCKMPHVCPLCLHSDDPKMSQLIYIYLSHLFVYLYFLSNTFVYSYLLFIYLFIYLFIVFCRPPSAVLHQSAPGWSCSSWINASLFKKIWTWLLEN